MNRRVTIAVLILAPLLGAGIAIVASGGGTGAPPVADERATSPPLASSPPARASTVPTADMAGSTILAEDFDMLPTGGDVPEWQATDEATLEVAAAPTAVNRSARLSATGTGSACRPVAEPIANLMADFMVDPLPLEDPAALSIEIDADSRVALTISAEGATLALSSEPISLEPRRWYRWTVSRRDDSYEVSLSEAGGAELGRAAVEAADAAAERFCISTGSPTRIYLDTLTVEGH